MDILPLELLPTLEEGQLDQEGDADDRPAELLHEPKGRRHRPPRREEVVHNQDALARRDGVLVDGQSVAAVLQLIFHLDRLGRELAKLADRNESGPQLVGQGAAEKECP